MNSILLKNAEIFDGYGESLFPGDVLIENDRIIEVGNDVTCSNALTIDLRGQTLMPGIIDAHVHVYASELNMNKNIRRPWTYLAHYAGEFLSNMLSYGVTTIRDVGGGDYGLAQALESGLINGPRLFYGGRMISATGGHGDWRESQEDEGDHQFCNCGSIDHKMGVVVDGPDAVLKAVREELRRGADHIKILVSGGIVSPTGRVENLQFTDDEIRVICDEVTRQGLYVAAHCHPSAAVERSVRLGVRTIEHGTLIDQDTANYVRQKEAYIVPTMAVIHALYKDGEKLGLPAVSVSKVKEIFGQAINGLEIMKSAGCKIGFGTDLLGPTHESHGSEFHLRNEVFSPIEIMRQATSVNAEILCKEGELGCIKPGAIADLIAVKGNPIDDIGLLANQGRDLSLIIKGGSFHKNEAP